MEERRLWPSTKWERRGCPWSNEEAKSIALIDRHLSGTKLAAEDRAAKGFRRWSVFWAPKSDSSGSSSSVRDTAQAGSSPTGDSDSLRDDEDDVCSLFFPLLSQLTQQKEIVSASAERQKKQAETKPIFKPELQKEPIESSASWDSESSSDTQKERGRLSPSLWEREGQKEPATGLAEAQTQQTESRERRLRFKTRPPLWTAGKASNEREAVGRGHGRSDDYQARLQRVSDSSSRYIKSPAAACLQWIPWLSTQDGPHCSSDSISKAARADVTRKQSSSDSSCSDSEAVGSLWGLPQLGVSSAPSTAKRQHPSRGSYRSSAQERKPVKNSSPQSYLTDFSSHLQSHSTDLCGHSRPNLDDYSGHSQSNLDDYSGHSQPNLDDYNGHSQYNLDDYSDHSQPNLDDHSGHSQSNLDDYSGHSQSNLTDYSGHSQPNFDDYSGHWQPNLDDYSGHWQSNLYGYSGHSQPNLDDYSGHSQSNWDDYSGYSQFNLNDCSSNSQFHLYTSVSVLQPRSSAVYDVPWRQLCERSHPVTSVCRAPSVMPSPPRSPAQGPNSHKSLGISKEKVRQEREAQERERKAKEQKEKEGKQREKKEKERRDREKRQLERERKLRDERHGLDSLDDSSEERSFFGKLLHTVLHFIFLCLLLTAIGSLALGVSSLLTTSAYEVMWLAEHGLVSTTLWDLLLSILGLVFFFLILGVTLFCAIMLIPAIWVSLIEVVISPWSLMSDYFLP